MPRILIVDDHPVVREGIGRILQGAFPDLALAMAGDATAAVDALASGAWDLVLLDLSLPEVDGTMLLRRLRHSHPQLPVVVVSMYPPHQFAQRATRAGAAAYVSKASPPHELARTVQAVLAGERRAAGRAERPLPEGGERRPHEALSHREYQVLQLIGQGRTVSQIAAELSLSVKTVSTYRARILEKMGLRTSAELMHYAIANRLVPWEAA